MIEPVRRIWLHIGAAKAGSTTLQAALRRDRADLARLGILHPEALSEAGRRYLLPAYLMGESVRPYLVDELGVLSGDTFDRLPTIFPGLWHQEVAAKEEPVVILSAEHLTRALLVEGASARMRQLLDLLPHGVEVRCLYVTRPLAERVRSAYGQRIMGGRAGRLTPAEFAGEALSNGQFDVARQLGHWEELLGQEAIEVLPLSRDLVGQTYRLLGVPEGHALLSLDMPARNRGAPLRMIEARRRANALPRFLRRPATRLLVPLVGRREATLAAELDAAVQRIVERHGVSEAETLARFANRSPSPEPAAFPPRKDPGAV